MRVVALIAAYNEERYLAQCLEHLFAQGVEAYLLDNDSTDGTVAIAEQHLGHGVIGIETIPRAQGYSLRTMLERREVLAATLEADWFMHMDPDEFRLAPDPARTLAQAFAEVEAQGCNAVNFLEFVFIPTQEAPDHDHPHFQSTMRWYYPFLPWHPHRLNAWKRQPGRVDLASSGGHAVRFPGLAPHPVPFRMRHYHFLSVPHAIAKLVGRAYVQADRDRGWHTWRTKLQAEMVALPPQAELQEYVSDVELDPSEPRRLQYLGELVAAHEQRAAAPAGPTAGAHKPAARPTAAAIYQRLGTANPYQGFDYTRYPFDASGGRDHPLFRQLIEDGRPELIIEVGSWKGRSALHMAGLLREQLRPGLVLCVDTWLGTSTQALAPSEEKWRIDSYRHHGYPTVYFQFLANVKYLGLQGYIVPLPNTSSIVARWLERWQVEADLIYIDASHDEADVYQDLLNYWGLLRPGGVLFGDDYWTAVGPGVINAVDRFAREQGQPLEVVDSKWVLRKPALARHLSQPSAPGPSSEAQALRAQVARLETQRDSLHSQLADASARHLAAAGELQALRRTRAYRWLAAYWQWRARLRRVLKPMREGG